MPGARGRRPTVMPPSAQVANLQQSMDNIGIANEQEVAALLQQHAANQHPGSAITLLPAVPFKDRRQQVGRAAPCSSTRSQPRPLAAPAFDGCCPAHPAAAASMAAAPLAPPACRIISRWTLASWLMTCCTWLSTSGCSGRRPSRTCGARLRRSGGRATGTAAAGGRRHARQQPSAAQARVRMREPSRGCRPLHCCCCSHALPPPRRQARTDGSSPALAAALQGVTHAKLFLAGEAVRPGLEVQELVELAADVGMSIVLPSDQALGVVGAAPPVQL